MLLSTFLHLYLHRISTVLNSPRTKFFLFGLTVTITSFVLNIYLSDLVRLLLAPKEFAFTPSIRVLREIISYAPWIVGGFLGLFYAWKGSSIKLGAYAAGAATPVVILMGFLFFGPTISSWHHQEVFDPVKWQQNDRTDVMWPARIRMVHDLLARNLLLGNTREQVEHLLGPRDDTTYFREWDLVYWLGPERGVIRIDSEWLVIRFGRDGRVTEAKTVRD